MHPTPTEALPAYLSEVDFSTRSLSSGNTGRSPCRREHGLGQVCGAHQFLGDVEKFEQASERALVPGVATLYFEAESEDDLRKIGYSKERRIDPQIAVGLLVDRTGFPLEIGCYEGNTAETTTIVPIVTSFLQRHQLQGTPLVVAADAGMLSGANLKALDELDLSFIVGSRVRKAPGDLECHFHWNGDVFTDGQVIDTVTPRHGNTKVNNTALRAEPVWDPEQHPGAWRASWSYSAKRARRDQKTLAAQEARARAIVDGDKKAKLLAGGLGAVETYLVEWYTAKRPGPCGRLSPRPGADDRRLLPDLAASGQTAPTIRLRRLSLAHIARGLGRPPAEVTGEQLVAWFGRQTHWRQRLAATTAARPAGSSRGPTRATASPTFSATICPPCVTARRCHGRSPTPCGVTRWPQSI